MAALDPWADSAPFPSASDLTVPASGSTASAILPQARHPPTDVPTQGGRLFDEALDVGAGWGHDDVPETEASGPSQGASSPAQHIPSGHVSSRPEDSSAAHSAAIVKGVEEDSLSDDFRDAQDSPAPSDAHLHHSFAKATPNLPTSLPHQQSSGSTTDVQPSTTNFEDDFGDFDDAPSMRSDGHASDDAFGDFDEGAVASGGGLATTGQAVLSSSAASQASLRSSLHVTLQSTASDLAEQIRDILSPPTHDTHAQHPFYEGAASQLGREMVKEGQRVRSGFSDKMWSQLTVQPVLQPMNYQRSHIRRAHLISLGIPVNLEEFAAPLARSRALPPLALSLKNATDAAYNGPSSAPAHSGSTSNLGQGASSRMLQGEAATPRTASPAPAAQKEKLAEKRREELGLRMPALLDSARGEELIKITEDQLSLQSLPYLQSLTSELSALTELASQHLTYHLTLRESHAADAEMYNGLIRDLVAGAASRIASSGGGAAGSRGDKRHTSIGLGGGAGIPSRVRGASGISSGRNSPAPDATFRR